jgi:hypothetical protein
MDSSCKLASAGLSLVGWYTLPFATFDPFVFHVHHEGANENGRNWGRTLFGGQVDSDATFTTGIGSLASRIWVDPFHCAYCYYSVRVEPAGFFMLRNSAYGSHYLNFLFFKPFGLTCVHWLALIQCNLGTKVSRNKAKDLHGKAVSTVCNFIGKASISSTNPYIGRCRTRPSLLRRRRYHPNRHQPGVH